MRRSIFVLLLCALALLFGGVFLWVLEPSGSPRERSAQVAKVTPAAATTMRVLEETHAAGNSPAPVHRLPLSKQIGAMAKSAPDQLPEMGNNERMRLESMPLDQLMRMANDDNAYAMEVLGRRLSNCLGNPLERMRQRVRDLRGQMDEQENDRVVHLGKKPDADTLRQRSENTKFELHKQQTKLDRCTDIPLSERWKAFDWLERSIEMHVPGARWEFAFAVGYTFGGLKAVARYPRRAVELRDRARSHLAEAIRRCTASRLATYARALTFLYDMDASQRYVLAAIQLDAAKDTGMTAGQVKVMQENLDYAGRNLSGGQQANERRAVTAMFDRCQSGS